MIKLYDFFGNTSNWVGGGGRLSVERHRLWGRRVFSKVKHRESLYVQKIGFFHSVGGDDFFLHHRVFVVRDA